jgi:hypothetical protein
VAPGDSFSSEPEGILPGKDFPACLPPFSIHELDESSSSSSEDVKKHPGCSIHRSMSNPFPEPKSTS